MSDENYEYRYAFDRSNGSPVRGRAWPDRATAEAEARALRKRAAVGLIDARNVRVQRHPPRPEWEDVPYAEDAETATR